MFPLFFDIVLYYEVRVSVQLYQSLSQQLNNCLLKVELYFDQLIVEFVPFDSTYHLMSLINKVMRVLSRLSNILHLEMIYAAHLV